MAFSGKATYSAFADEVAVDMSPIVALRAPIITPVLDAIGDADGPAVASTEHKWQVDVYAPSFSMLTSSAVNSATAAGWIGVAGWGLNCAPGDVLQIGSVDLSTGAEHIQIASISSANSIYVNRAVFGTSSTSLAIGNSLIFISAAALEGEASRPDISKARTTSSNWVQVISKGLEVSLSMEAVERYAQTGSETDYQMANRLTEAMRDLENAMLRGTSTGTIGSGTVYRTAKGLWNWITTTYTVTQNQLDMDFVDDAIRAGWLLGHYQGFNLMVVGGITQSLLDRLPQVQRIAMQDEANITRLVRTYESGLTNGPMRIVVTPNFDPRAFILCHTDDLSVKPMQGRSMAYYPYALTGQSRKGEIVGEYTLEVRAAESLVRGYITA